MSALGLGKRGTGHSRERENWVNKEYPATEPQVENEAWRETREELHPFFVPATVKKGQVDYQKEAKIDRQHSRFANAHL